MAQTSIDPFYQLDEASRNLRAAARLPLVQEEKDQLLIWDAMISMIKRDMLGRRHDQLFLRIKELDTREKKG